MPCGGGDVGLNVWVEQGDLLFYIARSGCFDELGRMPKLGRVRVALDPSPFQNDAEAAPTQFRQVLDLARGCVQVHATSAACAATIDVWADVHRPVVHVGVVTDRPAKLRVAYENWRLTDRPFEKAEHHSARSWAGAPVTGVVMRDSVGFDTDGVTFYHRNAGETVFDLLARQQGLDAVKADLWDPLADLTFGGRLAGANLVPAGTVDGVYASTPFRAWRLQSRVPAREHHARIVMHTAQSATTQVWQEELKEIEASDDPVAERAKTEQWWAAFWQRSWIAVDPLNGGPESRPWQAGRNAQLFRYQLGCNAKGKYPTKFNGGLFTFDPEYIDPKKPLDPDFRAWGGTSFTAQNQRLVYWPMLASGDGDLMLAQLQFYRRSLGNARAHSRAYWNIDAACFVEQIELFGLCVGYEYGWKRKPETPLGVEDSAWVCYQWDTVFEFCQMALDRGRYFGADVSADIQWIESCLDFYESFYQLQSMERTGRPFDGTGKLTIFPGTACETYKDALNPTPTVCALRGVLRSLLELPDRLLPAVRKQRWQSMLATVPEVATRTMEGRQVFAPAKSWSRKQNCELPQLYSVYPWGEHGLFRSQLQTAIDTWRYGFDAPDQKQTKSWHQDPIFCARLGLVDEAAEGMLAKLTDAPRRFPTFWGPGHDWVPDHNQGGSGLIAMQEMLMQTVGNRIYLLPAWPQAWDVHFKLHAPYQTTVEVRLIGGKIESLIVTPPERMSDVVIAAAWQRESGEH